MLRSLGRTVQFLRRASGSAVIFGAGYGVCWAQGREESADKLLVWGAAASCAGVLRSLRFCGQVLPEAAEWPRGQLQKVESVELQWLAAFVDHCKAKGLDSPILQQLLLSVLCEHAEADPHGQAVQGLLDESARLPQELASRICEAAKGSESSESPAPCFLLPRLSGALVTLTALDSHELAQDLGPDGLLDVAKSATVASSWTASLETSRPGIRQELCEQEKDQVIQNLSAVWKALGKASATGVLRPSWERRLLRSKLEELKDRLPKPMRASVRDALVSWGGATKPSSGVGRLLEYISWGALGFLLLAISSEDGVGILRFHVVPDAWQPLIKDMLQQRALRVEELLAKYDAPQAAPPVEWDASADFLKVPHFQGNGQS